MPRIHRLSRTSITVLVGVVAACGDDRTPLAPTADPAIHATVADAAREPAGPVLTERVIFSGPGEGPDHDIFSMNPDGTDRRPLTTGPADDRFPDVSPDGRKIVFTRTEPGGVAEIYVMAADGSRLRKLTAFGPAGSTRTPAWSPDGKRIAFAGVTEGSTSPDIFVMSANGRNVTRLTVDDPAFLTDDSDPAWSPDGLRIAFTRIRLVGNVMVMNADGSGVQNLTGCVSGSCQSPSWSPDGTRIAYESLTSLTSTLLVKAVGQPAQQIATNVFGGVGGPAWAPDGTRLVYPGIVTVNNAPLHALVAVAPDGSAAQPLVPGGAGGQDPVWAGSR